MPAIVKKGNDVYQKWYDDNGVTKREWEAFFINEGDCEQFKRLMDWLNSANWLKSTSQAEKFEIEFNVSERVATVINVGCWKGAFAIKLEQGNIAVVDCAHYEGHSPKVKFYDAYDLKYRYQEIFNAYEDHNWLYEKYLFSEARGTERWNVRK